MHAFIAISKSIKVDTSIDVLLITEANTILPSFFAFTKLFKEKKGSLDSDRM